MAMVSAKCTKCGKMLRVDNRSDAEICRHCGAAFVVEKAIRYFQTGSPLPGGANASDACDKDFRIYDGRLSRYEGISADVVIPKGVTSIGGAFERCTHIRTVVIPEGVTEIGDVTFWDCSSLERVTIPEGVVKIENAFRECRKLSGIRLPQSLRFLKCSFKGCNQIRELDIPAGIEYLNLYTGSFINKITLHEGMTSISDDAFRSCAGLREITIPSTITSIGDNAFSGCGNLTTVNCSSARLMEKLEPHLRDTLWYKHKQNRMKGLCTDCGGAFKGFLTKKCVKCGKVKDY